MASRDEVNRREVCECDGCVCDLDDAGTPSILRLIRGSATQPWREVVVYYESIKRESARLAYTGLRRGGGLEHLKIETRLINERFASVVGECDIVTVVV